MAEQARRLQSSDELLGKVYTAVKEAYGEKYVPGMMFDEAMLEGTFGISKDQYDSYVAEGPMISVHVETFVGIKAKEGKAGDVAKELEAYRKKQIEEAVQYPMNMTKLEASQVITHGDYVFFVMLGEPIWRRKSRVQMRRLNLRKKIIRLRLM